MFRKILIANRGESAIRIWRTCRELGIATVGVVEQSDSASLHGRLCDEVYLLPRGAGYLDGAALLALAHKSGADAIHPGYGFLARCSTFVRACEQQGITFIGPDSRLAGDLENRWSVLARVKAAGLPTPEISTACYPPAALDALRAEADRLGYPCLVKSCSGADLHTWFVHRAAAWPELRGRLEQCTPSSEEVPHYYIERAIYPARKVLVQLMAGRDGQMVVLGERDGSLQSGAYRLIDETPCPGLTPHESQSLGQRAAEIGRLLKFHTQGVFEFLVSPEGVCYFLEVKPTIQVGHAITELLTGVDLVAEQIKFAAGDQLRLSQEKVSQNGWAIQCRINAVDPSQNFLASPGQITGLRLPGGAGIRVSTHLACGSEVSGLYAPLVAMIAAWGHDRAECLARLDRALAETSVEGIATDLPVHRAILDHPVFQQGSYSTEFLAGMLAKGLKSMRGVQEPERLADLAAAAAVAYLRRSENSTPETPALGSSGWPRRSRQLG